jgi:hypothetical protein
VTLDPSLLWTIGIVLVAILALAWPFMMRELVPSAEELARSTPARPKKGMDLASASPLEKTPMDAALIQAVIIASVASVVEEEFRITSMDEVTAEIEMSTQWSSWASEGRRQIFASHRIR